MQRRNGYLLFRLGINLCHTFIHTIRNENHYHK